MTANLLHETWVNLDSQELKLLLNEHIRGFGEYDDRQDILCLPHADSSCRLKLTYRDKVIVSIEPGPAFDVAEWGRIREGIEKSLLTGPPKVGRDWSFSSFQVLGPWRGSRSGVQILPPPADTPRAPVEMADHPFILEFPIIGSDIWSITNHRRLREHRKLTLLLNILLAGRTSHAPRRPEHFWAGFDDDDGHLVIKWVQQFFFANLGEVVVDELSSPVGEKVEEMEPDEYYANVGHDGKGLRVPADLDQSICNYMALSAANRAKFDRATYWMDMASRQWDISISLSFTALVSAIESLTERGKTHVFECPICGNRTQHELPGATRRFKDFFETYAKDVALAKRRDDMYALRSSILHGGELMQLDQDLAFGWDPPRWSERELHDELWSLTRIALRNWLKDPPST